MDEIRRAFYQRIVKFKGVFPSFPLSRIPSEWNHQKPVCATSPHSWKPEIKSEEPVHFHGPPALATATVHRLRPRVTDAGELGFPQGPRPGCCRVRFPCLMGEASDLPLHQSHWGSWISLGFLCVILKSSFPSTCYNLRPKAMKPSAGISKSTAKLITLNLFSRKGLPWGSIRRAVPLSPEIQFLCDLFCSLAWLRANGVFNLCLHLPLHKYNSSKSH